MAKNSLKLSKEDWAKRDEEEQERLAKSQEPKLTAKQWKDARAKRQKYENIGGGMAILGIIVLFIGMFLGIGESSLTLFLYLMAIALGLCFGGIAVSSLGGY